MNNEQEIRKALEKSFSELCRESKKVCYAGDRCVDYQALTSMSLCLKTIKRLKNNIKRIEKREADKIYKLYGEYCGSLYY